MSHPCRRPCIASVLLVALVCSLALPSAARAADDAADLARTGFYLGLGAVYAIENFTLRSDDLGMAAILGPDIDPNFDDSQGVHVIAGYRAHPLLGFEFLYEFLEGFDSTSGPRQLEIDSHLVVVNAKIYPLEGCLQPFVLFGVGTHIINSEIVRDPTVSKPFQTDAGFVTRVGGGLDYYATDHLVVEAEGSYMLGSGGILRGANYGALALHFLYRF